MLQKLFTTAAIFSPIDQKDWQEPVSSRTYRPRYIGWFRGLIGYVQKLIKKEAKHVIYIWKAEILVIRTM